MRRPTILTCTGLLVLAACGDDDPAGPDVPTLPLIVSDTVVDGASGGIAGFHFLEPLSRAPSSTGNLDSAALERLTVVVCALDGVGCTHGDLVTYSGSETGWRGAAIHSDSAGHYEVTWHMVGLRIDAGLDYRIRVEVDGEELGHADVDVLSDDELLAATAADLRGIRLGDSLPIRFRIETGVISHVTLEVTTVPDSPPLLHALDVLTLPAAEVTVDYWADDAPRLRMASAADTLHRVTLARLLPDTPYSYEVRIPGEGVGAVIEGGFRTDTLPDDLEAVTLTSTGQATTPLTMLELRPPTFQGFVAVDSKGRIVWYYRTAGASWSWTRRSNGNFVFMDTSDGLTEVTPLGEAVATVSSADVGQTIHHDVIATPQNTVYFLGRQPRAINGTTWIGEMIWEWNPDTGDLTQLWSSFDFLSPTVDVGPRTRTGDWLHANALNLGPSGIILMSLQATNQILAISSDFSELVWRLGGINATIVPDSAAAFSGQHTAAELANGHVLMFDNRIDSGGYSRGLELALDTAAGVATTAWSFRAPNDNFSAIISAARRMANGNTLVTFGAGEGIRASVGPIEVYEVTMMGDVVWNLVIEGGRLMYRATPFDQVMGEVVVPD